MWRADYNLDVVPANAGTHTARTPVFGAVVDAFYCNERQGLWVPAFAGTTQGKDSRETVTS